MNIEEILS